MQPYIERRINGLIHQESNNFSHLGMSCSGNLLHREALSAVVLDSSEADDSDRVSLLFDNLEDLGRAECEFSWQRVDREERRGRVVVYGDLRCECVLPLGRISWRSGCEGERRTISLGKALPSYIILCRDGVGL